MTNADRFNVLRAACVRYLASTLSLSLALSIAHAAPLTIGYLPRPGLAEMVDGRPLGTYLPTAFEAIAQAHLEATWVALPQKRLINDVHANVPNYCAMGTFKTPERLEFAKFSHPIHRDRPYIVSTLKRNEAAIRKHKTFAELATDEKLKIGIIEGFSYGAKFDPILAKMTINSDRMTGTVIQELAKLVAGRFDYILATSDDAAVAIDGNYDPSIFATVEFPDIPPGELRYFMCSMAVSDEVMARLNAGIDTLRLRLEP